MIYRGLMSGPICRVLTACSAPIRGKAQHSKVLVGGRSRPMRPTPQASPDIDRHRLAAANVRRVRILMALCESTNGHCRLAAAVEVARRLRARFGAHSAGRRQTETGQPEPFDMDTRIVDSRHLTPCCLSEPAWTWNDKVIGLRGLRSEGHQLRNAGSVLCLMKELLSSRPRLQSNTCET